MSDNHGGLYNLINTHEKRIAELEAQIVELRELACNLYTLAKHCPCDKIADDFDFCTPLDHAEALLQEKPNG